jgi:hypothetical protein
MQQSRRYQRKSGHRADKNRSFLTQWTSPRSLGRAHKRPIRDPTWVLAGLSVPRFLFSPRFAYAQDQSFNVFRRAAC